MRVFYASLETVDGQLKILAESRIVSSAVDGMYLLKLCSGNQFWWRSSWSESSWALLENGFDASLRGGLADFVWGEVMMPSGSSCFFGFATNRRSSDRVDRCGENSNDVA